MTLTRACAPAFAGVARPASGRARWSATSLKQANQVSTYTTGLFGHMTDPPRRLRRICT